MQALTEHLPVYVNANLRTLSPLVLGALSDESLANHQTLWEVRCLRLGMFRVTDIGQVHRNKPPGVPDRCQYRFEQHVATSSIP